MTTTKVPKTGNLAGSVTLGPLRTDRSAEQMVSSIMKLLNCIGIRATEISDIAVEKDVARITVKEKEVEGFLIMALKLPGHVMNVFNLRQLSHRPHTLTVKKIKKSTKGGKSSRKARLDRASSAPSTPVVTLLPTAASRKKRPSSADVNPEEFDPGQPNMLSTLEIFDPGSGVTRTAKTTPSYSNPKIKSVVASVTTLENMSPSEVSIHEGKRLRYPAPQDDNIVTPDSRRQNVVSLPGNSTEVSKFTPVKQKVSSVSTTKALRSEQANWQSVKPGMWKRSEGKDLSRPGTPSPSVSRRDSRGGTPKLSSTGVNTTIAGLSRVSSTVVNMMRASTPVVSESRLSATSRVTRSRSHSPRSASKVGIQLSDSPRDSETIIYPSIKNKNVSFPTRVVVDQLVQENDSREVSEEGNNINFRRLREESDSDSWRGYSKTRGIERRRVEDRKMEEMRDYRERGRNERRSSKEERSGGMRGLEDPDWDEMRASENRLDGIDTDSDSLTYASLQRSQRMRREEKKPAPVFYSPGASIRLDNTTRGRSRFPGVKHSPRQRRYTKANNYKSLKSREFDTGKLKRQTPPNRLSKQPRKEAIKFENLQDTTDTTESSVAVSSGLTEHISTSYPTNETSLDASLNETTVISNTSSSSESSSSEDTTGETTTTTTTTTTETSSGDLNSSRKKQPFQDLSQSIIAYGSVKANHVNNRRVLPSEHGTRMNFNGSMLLTYDSESNEAVADTGEEVQNRGNPSMDRSPETGVSPDSRPTVTVSQRNEENINSDLCENTCETFQIENSSSQLENRVSDSVADTSVYQRLEKDMHYDSFPRRDVQDRLSGVNNVNETGLVPTSAPVPDSALVPNSEPDNEISERSGGNTTSVLSGNTITTLQIKNPSSQTENRSFGCEDLAHTTTFQRVAMGTENEYIPRREMNTTVRGVNFGNLVSSRTRDKKSRCRRSRKNPRAYAASAFLSVEDIPPSESGITVSFSASSIDLTLSESGSHINLGEVGSDETLQEVGGLSVTGRNVRHSVSEGEMTTLLSDHDLSSTSQGLRTFPRERRRRDRSYLAYNVSQYRNDNNLTLTSKTDGTISDSEDKSKIPKHEGKVKVDAKTSTGRVSDVSFCQCRIFYHMNELVRPRLEDKIQHGAGYVEFNSGTTILTKSRQFRAQLGPVLCAMLNSGGGALYYGTSPEGRVTGVKVGQREEDQVRLDIDDVIKSISPCVTTGLYQVNFAGIMGADGYLVPGLKVLELKVTSKPWSDVCKSECSTSQATTSKLRDSNLDSLPNIDSDPQTTLSKSTGNINSKSQMTSNRVESLPTSWQTAQGSTKFESVENVDSAPLFYSDIITTTDNPSTSQKTVLYLGKKENLPQRNPTTSQSQQTTTSVNQSASSTCRSQPSNRQAKRAARKSQSNSRQSGSRVFMTSDDRPRFDFRNIVYIMRKGKLQEMETRGRRGLVYDDIK